MMFNYLSFSPPKNKPQNARLGFVALIWAAMLLFPGLGAAQCVPTNNTPGFTTFTVPAGNGAITVAINGADGGEGTDPSNGGNGRGGSGGQVQATFSVNPGDIIAMIVGSAGGDGLWQGGGGGGTAVINCGNPQDCANGTILLVAGAGGGGQYNAANGGGGQNGATPGNPGVGNVAGGGGAINGAGGNGEFGCIGGGQASKLSVSIGGTGCGDGGNGGGGFGGGGGAYGDLTSGGGGGGYGGGNANGPSGYGAGGFNYVHPSGSSVTNNAGVVGDSGGDNSPGSITITCLACTPTFSLCPNAPVTANTATGVCNAAVTYTVAASGTPTPTLTYAFTGATTGSGSGTGSGQTFNVGNTTVTVTATNSCGTQTCSFTVTVTDNEPPSITCPGNQTVSTNSSCEGVVGTHSAVSATDNCGTPTVSQSNSGDGILSGHNNSQTVTLTATDAGGNSANCSFTVTLKDVTAPSITCAANQTINTDPGVCTAAVTVSAPTILDNCSISSPTLNFSNNAGYLKAPLNGSLLPLNQLTVEFWAYDDALSAAGGFAGNLFNWEIQPSANTPFVFFGDFGNRIRVWVNGGYRLDIYHTAGQWHHYALTFTSNTWRVYYDGNLAGTYTGGNANKNRALDIYVDGNSYGNWNGKSDEIRVWDIARSISDIQTNMSSNVSPTSPGLIGYWPLNDGTGSSTADDLSPSGNDATLITMDPSNDWNFFRLVGAPTVINNFNNTANASGTYPGGTTNVVWTATDAAGNAATCAQTVTVVDNQAPTITCPDNITANTDAGFCSAVVNYTAPAGTDNCSGQTTARTAGLASGAAFPVGSTTNTFVVTAANSQTASCSFTVTVTDNLAPSITCPANTTVSANSSCEGAVGTHSAVSATDNCGTPTVLQSNSGDGNLSGSNDSETVTLTANDGNGNSANCSFTVTLIDATAPTITCPTEITVVPTGNGCSVIATWAAPAASDNCTALPTMTGTHASGNTFSGNTTVTLQAADAAGNTATCTFTVTLNDATPPTITCSPAMTIAPAVGTNCEAKATLNSPIAFSDNCSPFAVENNLHFDAVNDRVSIPSSADFNFGTGNFTIEMWVKTTGTSFQIFVDKRINSSAGTWWRTGLNNGKYWFEISASQNCLTNNLFNDGNWHHVAFVRNGTSPAIFVDGVSVPVTIAGAWDANVSNTANVGLGLFLGNSCCGLKGQMDELRIWKSARTQVEILANKNIPLSGSEANLLAYYNFNHGTAGGNNAGLTTLTDLATAIGGANNGTLTNFALAGATSNWVGAGPISPATNDAPAVFPTGNTTVTWSITDAAGNTSTCQQTVTALASTLAVSHTVVNATCFGSTNGTIFTTTTGGLSPFSYSWSNAKTTANINLLAAGTYTVNVSESTGCSTSATVVLGQPTAISFAVGLTSNGGAPPTFNAVFTTSGGTPGYLFNRTGMASTLYLAATDVIFQNLAANTSYIFKVKDANGCLKSAIKKTPAAMPTGGVADRSEVGRELTDEEALLPDEVMIARFENEILGKNFAPDEMLLFPNPSSNLLNIKFLDEKTVIGRVEIFNQIGQKVLSQNLKIESGEQGQLEVGHLPEGTYFLKVTPNASLEKPATARFVVLKK